MPTHPQRQISSAETTPLMTVGERALDYCSRSALVIACQYTCRGEAVVCMYPGARKPGRDSWQRQRTKSACNLQRERMNTSAQTCCRNNWQEQLEAMKSGNEKLQKQLEKTKGANCNTTSKDRTQRDRWQRPVARGCPACTKHCNFCLFFSTKKNHKKTLMQNEEEIMMRQHTRPNKHGAGVSQCTHLASCPRCRQHSYSSSQTGR